jgi:hypothetical protein
MQVAAGPPGPGLHAEVTFNMLFNMEEMDKNVI